MYHNPNPGRFDTDIDMDAIEQSEREAMRHESKAEQSRDAWADAAHEPGATTVIRPEEVRDDTPGAAVHVTATGDNHVLLENIGAGDHAAYAADTTDLGLVQFHDIVVAVAEGAVDHYRGPATLREVGDAEAERLMADAMDEVGR